MAPAVPLTGVIRAPWGDDPALRAAVRRLREAGETVLSVLPGEPDDEAGACDRELAHIGGRWLLRALALPSAEPAAGNPARAIEHTE